MNDIVINKIQSIQRCIERVGEEYKTAGKNFSEDYTRQDAAILNVLRACEQAIDLANHIIKIRKLGIPTSSAESFELLAKKQIISFSLYESLKNMVGFRNKAIHEYQRMDIEVISDIVDYRLNDLLKFTDKILEIEKD